MSEKYPLKKSNHHGLALNSSSLVQRGLSALKARATLQPAQQNRMLHFPKNRKYGTLLFAESAAFNNLKWTNQIWKSENIAKGLIEVPYNLKVGLSTNITNLKILDNIDRTLILGLICNTNDGNLDDLSRLAGLTSLTSLSIEIMGEIGTDAALSQLASLNTLLALRLSSYEFIDVSLVHLGKLSSLKELSLSGCYAISDASLVHLGKLSSLKELSLSGCYEISDASLLHLGKLSSLEELDLDSTQVTDFGLAHLEKLTSLRKLNLCGCDQITDAGLGILGILHN